jgi:hypothetical protein
MKFSDILPIITLVLGAFLYPFIDRFFKKPQEKRRLKFEAIENVYILFNLLKKHCQQVNHNHFINRRVTVYVDRAQLMINTAQKSGEVIPTRELKEYQRYVAELQSKFVVDEYFEKMTYIESKLSRISVESVSYLDAISSEKLNSIVSEILDYCNNQSSMTVYNFDDLTESDLYGHVAHNLETKVREKHTDIQHLCDQYIKRLKAIKT